MILALTASSASNLLDAPFALCPNIFSAPRSPKSLPSARNRRIQHAKQARIELILDKSYTKSLINLTVQATHPVGAGFRAVKSMEALHYLPAQTRGFPA
jgi:hypothetical protein